MDRASYACSPKQEAKSYASAPMEVSFFRFSSPSLHDHSFFARMMGELQAKDNSTTEFPVS